MLNPKAMQKVFGWLPRPIDFIALRLKITSNIKFDLYFKNKKDGSKIFQSVFFIF